MKNSKIKIIAILAGIFFIGFLFRGCFVTKDQHQTMVEPIKGQQQIWTCSMHPQIRQPKPGKCPICFMDLIPVETTHIQVAGPNQISFSQEALKLMEVDTTPVERKFVDVNLNMIGKIDYDESRIKDITAWVSGRIDRLFVDFTGITVNQNDHMIYLYSPQLLSAQAELIQAIKSSTELKPGSSDIIKQSFRSTVEVSREKLRLLGLTSQQIEEIEKTNQVSDHLTIYSPISGAVIEKLAKAGDYVETGQIIYRVADLSKIWVNLSAYESDLTWVRYGQKVEFTVEALPGQVFTGIVNFIDPILDPNTRTVRVRVNADNPEKKLKPQMFVRAVLHAKIGSEGTIENPEIAGKWICPMHPEIVKDKEGQCDICQMDLVQAESLGFVSKATTEPPLVVPASAVLYTGSRSIVYVQVPDTNVPTFEGRQILLGPRAGDYYIVKSGLKEGELVVTKGNFKIDASLQIEAKPSMMNPQGQKMPAGHEGHKM